MFASRSFGGFGSGGNSLDVPVASLAGLAVAFLAFAAPAELLADLVGASGLPSILPAAEPPLGLTARLGVGAAGAIFVFATAFLLLRWLGRASTRRAEHAAVQADVDAPRLRRRDIHPDAPARAPLLAVHELGDPNELVLDQVQLARRAAWEVDASPMSHPQPQAEPAIVDAPPVPVEAASCEANKPPMQEPHDQADAYALSQRRWADLEAPYSARSDDPWHDERISTPESESQPHPGSERAISPKPEWDATSQQPWADAAGVPVPLHPEREGEPEWEPAAPSVKPWAEPADMPVSRHPEIEAESEWEPADLSAQPGAEPAGVRPPEHPQPEAEAEPEWEPAAAVQPWSEPADLPLPSTPEPFPESEPADSAPPFPEPFVAPVPEPAKLDAEPEWERPSPQPWPEPVERQPGDAGPPPASGSIAELMARLELGLARRGVGPAGTAPPPPAAAPERPAPPAPQPAPDLGDDRLQNAIQSLQRFAARQD